MHRSSPWVGRYAKSERGLSASNDSEDLNLEQSTTERYVATRRWPLSRTLWRFHNLPNYNLEKCGSSFGRTSRRKEGYCWWLTFTTDWTVAGNLLCKFPVNESSPPPPVRVKMIQSVISVEVKALLLKCNVPAQCWTLLSIRKDHFLSEAQGQV